MPPKSRSTENEILSPSIFPPFSGTSPPSGPVVVPVKASASALNVKPIGTGPLGVSIMPVHFPSTGAATADAATVAVMPSQLPAATATALDGTGTGQATVANPGNLADLADQKFWQGKVSGGMVTDAHTAAAGADGQEFALLTADGGALVFYTDAAELTITPPAGSLLRLTVPGFYSPAQPVNQATLSYLEQFAAYDPPAGGGGAPSIVADYSGITGKN